MEQSSAEKKIALITLNPALAEQVKEALAGLFEVMVYNNGLALHHAMQDEEKYAAILSDDELRSANGIPLLHTLIKLGYGTIPFMAIINQIDEEQRNLAMKNDIADIFTKPIDKNSIRIRVPYLVNNFRNHSAVITPNKPYHLPLIKRVFDIFFSGLALLMLSPLFLLIIILIRAESKGKVFYYSLRVGTGYQIFKFYKFRSMFTGADARLKELSHLNQYALDGKSADENKTPVKELCDLCEQAGSGCQQSLFSDNKVICEKLYKQQQASKMDAAFIKIKDDPRITKVGKFIRNTSMDELPQLWNVFIGDMSIVGNRPLPLYEAEKITSDKYALRFMAPAGITGLWQVEKRGRGEMSEEERLNLDNNYAKTHSFLNDIRLILRTIPALFQSENV